MPLEKKERVSTFKRSKDASDSDSDSGPEDRNPPPSKKGKPSKGGPPKDSSGEPTWELGQNKKVKVQKLGIIIINLKMDHIKSYRSEFSYLIYIVVLDSRIQRKNLY